MPRPLPSLIAVIMVNISGSAVVMSSRDLYAAEVDDLNECPYSLDIRTRVEVGLFLYFQ